VPHQIEVAAQAHDAKEVLELLARFEVRRLVMQPDLDLAEPSCFEPGYGLFGRNEIRRRRFGPREIADYLEQLGDVAPSAPLRDELATVPHRGREIREKRVVIGDPVKDGVRKDDVDRLGDG